MPVEDAFEWPAGTPLFEVMWLAVSDGIANHGVLSPGDFQISDDPNTELGILVEPGDALYDGTTYNIGGQTAETLNAADANYDRWDTVYLDPSGPTVAVEPGTAEANPVAPSPPSGLFLGVVEVPAGATDIGTEQVYNWRSRATTGGTSDSAERFSAGIIIGDDPEDYPLSTNANGELVLENGNTAEEIRSVDPATGEPTYQKPTTFAGGAAVAPDDLSTSGGATLSELSFYLRDDYADDALNGRTGAATGKYLEHSGRVESASVLTGRFRPEWTVEAGSPSATGGEAVLSAGDATTQVVSTPSGFEAGEWEFEFAFSADPTAGELSHYLMFEDANNSWRVRANADGTLALTKLDAGGEADAISGTWTVGTTRFTVRVTRTDAGEWELFLDGTSEGAATDTFVPAVQEVRFENTADAEVSVDDYHVR